MAALQSFNPATGFHLNEDNQPRTLDDAQMVLAYARVCRNEVANAAVNCGIAFKAASDMRVETTRELLSTETYVTQIESIINETTDDTSWVDLNNLQSSMVKLLMSREAGAAAVALCHEAAVLGGEKLRAIRENLRFANESVQRMEGMVEELKRQYTKDDEEKAEKAEGADIEQEKCGTLEAKNGNFGGSETKATVEEGHVNGVVAARTSAGSDGSSGNNTRDSMEMGERKMRPRPRGRGINSREGSNVSKPWKKWNENAEIERRGGKGNDSAAAKEEESTRRNMPFRKRPVRAGSDDKPSSHSTNSLRRSKRRRTQ